MNFERHSWVQVSKKQFHKPNACCIRFVKFRSTSNFRIQTTCDHHHFGHDDRHQPKKKWRSYILSSEIEETLRPPTIRLPCPSSTGSAGSYVYSKHSLVLANESVIVAVMSRTLWIVKVKCVPTTIWQEMSAKAWNKVVDIGLRYNLWLGYNTSDIIKKEPTQSYTQSYECVCAMCAYAEQNRKSWYCFCNGEI